MRRFILALVLCAFVGSGQAATVVYSEYFDGRTGSYDVRSSAGVSVEYTFDFGTPIDSVTARHVEIQGYLTLPKYLDGNLNVTSFEMLFHNITVFGSGTSTSSGSLLGDISYVNGPTWNWWTYVIEANGHFYASHINTYSSTTISSNGLIEQGAGFRYYEPGGLQGGVPADWTLVDSGSVWVEAFRVGVASSYSVIDPVLKPFGDPIPFSLEIRNPFPNAIPIPATAYLFASALGLLGWMRRRRCHPLLAISGGV